MKTIENQKNKPVYKPWDLSFWITAYFWFLVAACAGAVIFAIIQHFLYH